MQPVLESRYERRLSGAQDGSLHSIKPQALRDIGDTGLPFLFLVELTLKTIFNGGQLRLWDLKERLKLPVAIIEPIISFMRSERLCEVQQRGVVENEIAYALTDLGRSRAHGAMEKSLYVGPVPVTLQAYEQQIERQSVNGLHIGREDVHRAFDGIVIAERLLDQVGPAMNSGRAIFIHGPSGSGKTFIAEHLFAVLGGTVYVPYAIAVEDEVIQVFDPLSHKVVAGHDGEIKSLDRRHAYDERWVACQRPVVMTGGELTLSMLDLEFDPTTRFYTAPPQIKANNGLLIIDDLGRQLVSPRDLLNRWIVPLDRRVDYLALHTGKKFRVPFDMALVFSTNLAPGELADAAFLRRLGYKILVGPVDEDQYKSIFQQVCARYNVPYAEDMFDYLLHKLHKNSGQPLLACYPQDIVSKVRDRAQYEGGQLELSEEVLDWAWLNYFGAA